MSAIAEADTASSESKKRRTAAERAPSMRWPLQFRVTATWQRARVASMQLPHFLCHTPMFMPVGTKGTLKGLLPEQLEALNVPLILGNTYHLGDRPGAALLRTAGGLHAFMGWQRNLLTDSGGFQMVSLLPLANITEEGVSFESPYDGSKMMLTPEHSMEIQNAIGADIMMQLDDVVHSTTEGPRVEEAMHRSIRWLDRCVAAHARKSEQNLFGIIQGGLDARLRAECLREMTRRDLPGFAIGGLSGGESKDKFWRVVAQCTAALPADKPRYLMGVGYALDLVVCSALGVDMYDCVFPTRTARFGSALVDSGDLQLRKEIYAHDFRPIDDACECFTCKNYTRAFLHTIAQRERTAAQLLTVHNVAYQMRLMQRIRDSISAGTFDEFVRTFMRAHCGRGAYPRWAVDALKEAGIDLSNEANAAQATSK